MPRFAANLTMLFTEYPFLERFEKAAEAGFKGVEFLFPYEHDPMQLKKRLKDNQLEQVLFNMPPGDWDAGERGIACLPERKDEFRHGIVEAVRYAKVLGCKQINCLAGLKPDNLDDECAWETLDNNLCFAADSLLSEGMTLMVEAINSRVDMPGFLVDSSVKALDLLLRCQKKNLKFQYDLYHMQIMEGDLLRTIERHLGKIGHIQFADNPGRHEPGTGEINYSMIFQCLDKLGYKGWVSAEYRPLISTHDSLKWLQN